MIEILWKYQHKKEGGVRRSTAVKAVKVGERLPSSHPQGSPIHPWALPLKELLGQLPELAGPRVGPQGRPLERRWGGLIPSAPVIGKVLNDGKVQSSPGRRKKAE